MSILRQSCERVLVRCFGVTFTQSQLVPPSSNNWDQLVYASKGIITVQSEAGTWVLPPLRAVWLPAGMAYELRFSQTTALRMLYLPNRKRRTRAPVFDRSNCAIVSVSPLLRELIIRANEIGALVQSEPHQSRLAGLIEDELDALRLVPLELPWPSSIQAKAFAKLYGSDEDRRFDIPMTLKECGSSRRTMERLFVRETGMSLGKWTVRRKLLIALQFLHEGDTVAEIAFRLGYNGPSAFISMFKRELGSTPSTYFQKN